MKLGRQALITESGPGVVSKFAFEAASIGMRLHMVKEGKEAAVPDARRRDAAR